MSRSERIHLAQELHDGIAQDLVGFGYSLDLLLAEPDTPILTRAELRKLRFTITGLLEKVRSEIHQLHSGSEINLAKRIIESAYELCDGIALDLDVDDLLLADDGEIAYEIVQIARELLRNIATHAQATHVQISLSFEREVLCLIIEDDGIGGISQTPYRFGLVGAKTRAASLGGALTIDSNSSGTCAELIVPLTKVLAP